MSPIFVRDFIWNQDNNLLTIRLKWPSTSPNADILTSKNYVKISSPPYIFELFLALDINDSKSKCYKINNEYVFELKKEDPGLWDNIELTIEKSEKVKRRREAIDSKQQADAQESELKRNEKRKLQNLAIQEQIGLDSVTAKIIDDIKAREKAAATRSIEEYKKKTVPLQQDIVRSSVNHNASRPSKSLVSCDFAIPLVRQQGKIEVQFSAREFPTPTRESLLEEEKEFLAKQLAARKATGFVSEDLRPEECNPVWLKKKGDEFHKNKNYLGAVSAYSHAIKIGSKMPAMFSNRAASHMELGNFHKALEDCSTALELLTPRVSANAEARARAHSRRAAILCRLGLPEKSLSEFEEAMKLRPEDHQLRIDYERAKLSLEENDDSE